MLLIKHTLENQGMDIGTDIILYEKKSFISEVHWFTDVLYELHTSNKVIWLRSLFFMLCEKFIQHCWSLDEPHINCFHHREVHTT